MTFLLDTNIIIFWLKKRHGIDDKIASIGLENCFVSEITIAELSYGVECSPPELIQQKRLRLSNLLTRLQVIPFAVAIELYAQEKARLRANGEIISDFDILIGATAVETGMTLVTNNAKHLSRIKGTQIEDWTEKNS